MAGLYFVTAVLDDEHLEDGPVVTGPLGGVIRYETLDEAGDAAKALVAGGTVKGAFVQKLRPVALYTPTSVATFQEKTERLGN